MKNKYYGSTLEWRDYEFFVCDAEKQEKTIQMLMEREFLLPSKMPNAEKIKSLAEDFAASLAERISRSGRSKHFGLANIADNVEKFSKLQDSTSMYYYMAYLYGSVFWRVPYNVQRFPVAPDALKVYLETFSETLVAALCLYSEIQDEESQEEETETENEDD